MGACLHTLVIQKRQQICQAIFHINRVTDCPATSSWPAKQATGRIGAMVFTPPSLVTSSLSWHRGLIEIKKGKWKRNRVHDLAFGSPSLARKPMINFGLPLNWLIFSKLPKLLKVEVFLFLFWFCLPFFRFFLLSSPVSSSCFKLSKTNTRGFSEESWLWSLARIWWLTASLTLKGNQSEMLLSNNGKGSAFPYLKCLKFWWQIWMLNNDKIWNYLAAGVYPTSPASSRFVMIEPKLDGVSTNGNPAKWFGSPFFSMMKIEFRSVLNEKNRASGSELTSVASLVAAEESEMEIFATLRGD